MALETAVTINQLDPANPSGPDRIAQGDDHIRLIKAALKATFPNITGPVTVDQSALNALAGLAVPVGTISLWYGTAALVPGGYALCDGRTVAKTGGGTITTPDMRGRVPMGASEAAGSTTTPGTQLGQNSKTVTTEVAGAHDHTGKTSAAPDHSHTVTIGGTALTIAQMPAHSHDLKIYSDPNNSHDSSAEGDRTVSTSGTLTSGFTSSVGGGATHTHTGTGNAAGAHDHTITAAAAHAHSATVDVTQASIALHYIMKV